MNQHQDWEPVVLTKKRPVTAPPQRPAPKKEPSIDEEEGKKLKTVPVHMAQEISKARTSLGLSRVQLAQRINEKPSVVSDIETGGCVYNHVHVNKILKALGLTLKSVSSNQSK
jgi:ribosome-binding protein aMBF1 (putative translation factor)